MKRYDPQAPCKKDGCAEIARYRIGTSWEGHKTLSFNYGNAHYCLQHAEDRVEELGGNPYRKRLTSREI